MQLETVFTPREGGADIIIASKQDDPLWMILRWSEADSRLSGYSGGRSGKTLPSVKPISLYDGAITSRSVGTVAIWMFMYANNLKGLHEGDMVPLGAQDRLDEWENFLSGAYENKGNKDRSLLHDEEHVLLLKEQSQWMVGANFLKQQSGTFVPRRKQSFRHGLSISGFQALTVRDAVRKTFPNIPDNNVPDLKQARIALSGVKRPSSHAVYWYGTGDSDLSEIRGQAARAFPVLAGMIADNPIISRAVDNRESLQPHLIERTGLAKAGLKRIGRLSEGLPVGRLFDDGQEVRGEDALGVNRLRRFTVSGEVSLDAALKHLSELPPDRVPQNNESWLAYHDLLAGCAIPLEYALGIPVKQTLSACKGDWVQFRDQLAKAADFDPTQFDRRVMALTTIDAIEAVQDFARTTVLPVALSSITSVDEEVPDVSSEYFSKACDIAAKIFVGKSKNVAVNLYEMARRYVSRIPALNMATGNLGQTVDDKALKLSKYGSDSFPKFMEDYTAKNGRVIRSLDTFDRMRLESDRLNHCVGRLYLNRAYQVQSIILSVQNESGTESYSTIEISPPQGETQEQARQALSVVQHRAYNNANPSRECAEALEELMSDLKEGNISFNLDELNTWRELVKDDIKEIMTTWRGITEMDWEDEDVRKAAWEEWRYIVGGQYAKSPAPEVIFREKSARDLVAAMNAKAASLLIEKSKQPKPEPVKEVNDEPELCGP